MKDKARYSLVCILFFTTLSLSGASDSENPSGGEQKAEEKANPEERAGWLERILGFGKDRADKDEKPEKEAARSDKAKAEKDRGFSTKERAVLKDWQRGEGGWKKSGKRLPPGLQKKVARGGELPPGWKKKLAVGDKVPEEYESEAKSLPEEILKRLPETPEGTEIIRIGDEIIRVVENTREIIDILGIGEDRTE